MSKKISRKGSTRGKAVRKKTASTGRAADGTRAGRASAGPLTPADFERLTPEQIKTIKQRRRGRAPSKVAAKKPGGPRRGGVRAGVTADPNARVVVAEGDSWFDLPWAYVVTDLLDCLDELFDYKIESFARRGDTIENMVYGTDRQSLRTRKPPSIDKVLAAVRRLQPRVFLFSGGGNDFVGDEFASFLNHEDSGLSVIRDDYVNFMFDTVFAGAIRKLIDRVTSECRFTKVFMHGYGYAIPDGRGSRVAGIDWAGPWMLPALTSKGVPQAEQWGIVSELVDRYNAMLRGISIDPMYRDRFVYVDVRNVINEDDWVDELHLSSGGYARVAQRVHQEIVSAVPGW